MIKILQLDNNPIFNTCLVTFKDKKNFLSSKNY